MMHVYREWPGDYEIPGIGVPDGWARKSARKGGVNDGEPSGAQDKFGFSLRRYKFEIARLEGWTDYQAWVDAGMDGFEDGGFVIPHDALLDTWHEEHGSADGIRMRLVDGRACMGMKIGMSADKTLFDLLNEMGMTWYPASGANIASGEERINEMMQFVRDRDGNVLKKPAFTIDPGCVNHIWAFENYLGVDGLKAACKEPLDCCRYAAQSGVLDGSWKGNIMVLDPADNRNWFMGWYRIGECANAEMRECANVEPLARARPTLSGNVRDTFADRVEAMRNGTHGVDSRRICGGLRRW